MSKEKQIEEMAFNLIMATSPLGVKDLTKQFDYNAVATDLYELYGWRKQSEGEWVKDNPYFPIHCSQCKNMPILLAPLPNYCPNCGAKMKGGAE